MTVRMRACYPCVGDQSDDLLPSLSSQPSSSRIRPVATRPAVAGVKRTTCTAAPTAPLKARFRMSATALNIRAARGDERPAAANERLVLDHMDLVTRIAQQMLRRMPGHVELDDLIQAGMVGLLEAGLRFVRSETCSFTTFARHRIRGAMLDSLRKSDWSPRSLRRRARNIARAQQSLERDTCNAARPPAIAAAAGLPLEKYHETIRDCNLSMLLRLDELASPLGEARSGAVDANPRPDEELEQEQARYAMHSEIEQLPESERIILLLYYDEELLLREIGVVLKLTESRVCQGAQADSRQASGRQAARLGGFRPPRQCSAQSVPSAARALSLVSVPPMA